jgi:hypothetical protein
MIKKIFEIIRDSLAVVGAVYIIAEFGFYKIVASVMITVLMAVWYLISSELPKEIRYKQYKKHSLKRLQNLLKLEEKQ